MDNAINGALRSLFRLMQMDAIEACPKLLVDTEKNILKSRMEALNSEQIKTVINLWPDYHKKMSENQIIEDEFMKNNWKEFIKNIN